VTSVQARAHRRDGGVYRDIDAVALDATRRPLDAGAQAWFHRHHFLPGRTGRACSPLPLQPLQARRDRFEPHACHRVGPTPRAVNAIAPGVVDTPLIRTNLPAENVEYAMVDRVPMTRLSRANEQAASFVNGAVLFVDGRSSAGLFTRWNGAVLGSRALQEGGVYGPPASA
jgi:hypothetical protein